MIRLIIIQQVRTVMSLNPIFLQVFGQCRVEGQIMKTTTDMKVTPQDNSSVVFLGYDDILALTEIKLD